MFCGRAVAGQHFDAGAPRLHLASQSIEESVEKARAIDNQRKDNRSGRQCKGQRRRQCEASAQLRQPPCPQSRRRWRTATGRAARCPHRRSVRLWLRNGFLRSKLAGLHGADSHYHPLPYPLIDIGRDGFVWQPLLKEVEPLLLVMLFGHARLSLYTVKGDFKLTTHTTEQRLRSLVRPADDFCDFAHAQPDVIA